MPPSDYPIKNVECPPSDYPTKNVECPPSDYPTKNVECPPSDYPTKNVERLPSDYRPFAVSLTISPPRVNTQPATISSAGSRSKHLFSGS